MTARIIRSFDFQAATFFAGEFYMNIFEIDCQFNVEAESIREQNIALDRIKYFLSECLESAVLCHDKEIQAIEKFIDADLKVCSLPEEPYDQIVGIMLLKKLNSICEGRLVLTDITIGSKLSDGVSCLHSLEDNMGPFESRGWWSDTTPSFSTVTPKVQNKKVVKLAKKNKTDWEDIYLSWDDSNVFAKITAVESNTEIVFANFDKTEK